MKVLYFATALAILSALTTVAKADEQATNNGPLTASETQFVQSVQKDLMARFPRVGDAEKAGYVRYTYPDETGAISYANRQWASDPTHPSQLWYDKNGNLMGADFSVLRPHEEPRPNLWGIDPGRWYEFNGHVHFVVKYPNKTLYDQWIWNENFVKAGGDLSNPSAQTVVKIGRVERADYVSTIFDFPTIWDLIVWIKPHPAGEFHW